MGQIYFGVDEAKWVKIQPALTPDTKVSLAMVPEVIHQDPVAGVLLMTAQLNTQQTNAVVSAAEKGTLNAALLGQLFGATNLPGNLANLIEAAAKARFTAKMKTELKAALASGKPMPSKSPCWRKTNFKKSAKI